MWQRIQSVFLGIVIAALLGSMFLPVWEAADKTALYRLYPIYFMTRPAGASATIAPAYIPFCLTAILIVGAITVAIQEFRRFDNRNLQIKLGALNALLLTGVLIGDVYFGTQAVKAHPEAEGGYDLSLYLTGIAVVCNWLAQRFIRRDEKLVRDSDRLR